MSERSSYPPSAHRYSILYLTREPISRSTYGIRTPINAARGCYEARAGQALDCASDELASRHSPRRVRVVDDVLELRADARTDGSADLAATCE